jgi:hypothetical protein
MKSNPNFAPGEMAERSIAAVLKTVEGHTSGGSNPSLSAFFLHFLFDLTNLFLKYFTANGPKGPLQLNPVLAKTDLPFFGNFILFTYFW